jgi:hypothetical protein
MKDSPFERTLILTGCLVALVACLLSSCALVAIAFAPAFSGTVPSSTGSDPGQHDLTVIVREAYLNHEVTNSLPTSVPGTVTLDVQPGNRLVATAVFDLALTKLRVVTVLRISATAGRMQVTVLSVDVAGHELMSLANLIGLSGSKLGESMGGTIQDRIEEGLGQEAQILEVSTDETQLTIKAELE